MPDAFLKAFEGYNLQEVDLSYNNLTHIPKINEIFIERLNLAGNQIQEIDPQNLGHITRLNLYDNPLEKANISPRLLEQITNLQTLIISKDKLPYYYSRQGKEEAKEAYIYCDLIDEHGVPIAERQIHVIGLEGGRYAEEKWFSCQSFPSDSFLSVESSSKALEAVPRLDSTSTEELTYSQTSSEDGMEENSSAQQLITRLGDYGFSNEEQATFVEELKEVLFEFDKKKFVRNLRRQGFIKKQRLAKEIVKELARRICQLPLLRGHGSAEEIANELADRLKYFVGKHLNDNMTPKEVEFTLASWNQQAELTVAYWNQQPLEASYDYGFSDEEQITLVQELKEVIFGFEKEELAKRIRWMAPLRDHDGAEEIANELADHLEYLLSYHPSDLTFEQIENTLRDWYEPKVDMNALCKVITKHLKSQEAIKALPKQLVHKLINFGEEKNILFFGALIDLFNERTDLTQTHIQYKIAAERR